MASATPLAVVWKDAGLVHADRFGSCGARLVQLTFATDSLADLVEPDHDVDPWGWRHDPGHARAVLRLAASVAGDPALSPHHPDLVDLLARLTRRPTTDAGTPPTWFARVVQMIHDHDGAPLSVADLAAEADVHPVYLARCFRRYLGTGVAEELRRVRVMRAARDLGDSTETASRIAQRRGYADQAHFSRDFRSTVGVAPGAYRRMARQVAS